MRKKASDSEQLTAKNISSFVAAKLEADGDSLRVAAAKAGVSFNTLARVRKGHVPDLLTFRRLADWLGMSAGDLISDGSVTPTSTPDIIATHLQRDPALTREAASNIAAIVNDLYQKLAERPGRVEMHLRAARTFRPEAASQLSSMLADLQRAVEKRWG